jgi:hypothetical protein
MGTGTAGAATPGVYDTPGVLYSLPIVSLQLVLGPGEDDKIDVSSTLSNGRANYVLFQRLAGLCAKMDSHSEGGDSDLRTAAGKRVEVKAFYDQQLYPSTAALYDAVHTAASSTFGANNLGPKVKSLLDAGKYADALAVCSATGYEKNDFYLYTNTRGYRVDVPFRYLILTRDTVLSILDPTDPRRISRAAMLKAVTSHVTVPAADVVRAALAV